MSDHQLPIPTQKLTAIVLMAANFIPLLGVLFYDWDLQSVMLLYWLENLVVGLVNIIRILFVVAEKQIAQRLSKALFFCVHYGIFCLGHGALLFELLNIRIDGVDKMFSPFDFFTHFPLFFDFLRNSIGTTGTIALFGILVSHLFSLRTHYFIGGERYRLTISKAMHLPYQRIFVMQLGLLIGAFLIEEFGSTVLLLIAMIAAKIMADVFFHRKEHRTLAFEQAS